MDETKYKLYPIISNKLIKRLKEDYPNKLPDKQVSDFELGRLVGRQDIIDKLVHEKEYSESNFEP